MKNKTAVLTVKNTSLTIGWVKEISGCDIKIKNINGINTVTLVKGKSKVELYLKFINELDIMHTTIDDAFIVVTKVSMNILGGYTYHYDKQLIDDLTMKIILHKKTRT